MHRIDGLDHVANMFDEGDPLVPREATQVTVDWLNALQEEAVAIVLDPDSGLALNKPTNTQVRAALRVLFVRAKGAAAQTIDGLKTFTAKLTIQVATGVAQLLETTENTLAAQQVRNFGAGGGIDGSGLAYGVKGTATGSTSGAGVLGDGASGGYGVTAQGAFSSPQRNDYSSNYWMRRHLDHPLCGPGHHGQRRIGGGLRYRSGKVEGGGSRPWRPRLRGLPGHAPEGASRRRAYLYAAQPSCLGGR